MTLVTYTLENNIATIAMDDGKANVLSMEMQGEINAAFDRAEADKAVVIFTGREGRFSGGFDLKGLLGGGETAVRMLSGGFNLSHRILSFPYPTIIACSGHAIAMGAFLTLSADYRIGADWPFKIQANEVAIGLPLPQAAVEVCRQRLAPAHFHRATILSEVYSPQDAIAAGWLDRVVPADDLMATAREVATGFAALNMSAHTATKLRVREHALVALRAAIDADEAAFRAVVGA
jgi:enoyl-CoA hydratase